MTLSRPYYFLELALFSTFLVFLDKLNMLVSVIVKLESYLESYSDKSQSNKSYFSCFFPMFININKRIESIQHSFITDRLISDNEQVKTIDFVYNTFHMSENTVFKLQTDLILSSLINIESKFTWATFWLTRPQLRLINQWLGILHEVLFCWYHL